MKSYRRLVPLLLAIIIASQCEANTEKAIFLAPETANIPAQQPTLEALGLDVLTPTSASMRSRLNASFPDSKSPFGSTAWLLLYDLMPSQRYELRVCWAATQPTEFILDVFSMDSVWENPELISSLAKYAESRQHPVAPADKNARPSIYQRQLQGTGGTKSDSQVSVMFLRVLAAADFHSDSAAARSQVEPVLVDIILDPYLLNVVPQSLGPTIVYVVIVASLAWALAQRVKAYLLALSNVPEQVKKKAA